MEIYAITGGATPWKKEQWRAVAELHQYSPVDKKCRKDLITLGIFPTADEAWQAVKNKMDNFYFPPKNPSEISP